MFIRYSKESMSPPKVRTTVLVLPRTFQESMLTEESLNNHNSIQLSRGSLSWTFWTMLAGRSTLQHRSFTLSESPSDTGSDPHSPYAGMGTWPKTFRDILRQDEQDTHLLPATVASPEVTVVSPVSILNVVVFPAPFTPRRPKHCGRTHRIGLTLEPKKVRSVRPRANVWVGG